MGTQVQATTDYGSLFRPRVKTQAEKDRDAEARRRQGGGGNTAVQNNAPSAGDQRGGQNRGVDAPRTFKAREKNMAYKDHMDQIRQLRALATPSEDRGVLIFPTSELAKKFKNFKALATEYENNNIQCDVGNSQACSLAGRGSFPTDFPSPFTDSIHYNANSYFGVGDGSASERQEIRGNDGMAEASGSGSGDGSSETSQQRQERQRQELADKVAKKREKEAEGQPKPAPPPPPPSPAQPLTPAQGGVDGKHGDHDHKTVNPIAGGGGSHNGQSGSTSQGGGTVLPLDNGGGFDPINSVNPVKQYLRDLTALVDPYGIEGRSSCIFGQIKSIQH